MQLNNQMSGVQARAEREAAEDTILRLLDQRTSGWLIAESPPLGSLSLSFYLHVHHSPPVSQIFHNLKNPQSQIRAGGTGKPESEAGKENENLEIQGSCVGGQCFVSRLTANYWNSFAYECRFV